jgi:hypothetical protein
VRTRRAELDAAIADDFLEIGRSGRLYDKASATAALVAEPAPGAAPRVYTLHDFTGRHLAPDVVQVVFRLAVDLGDGAAARESMRTSIWRRGDHGWQILYHQGTRRDPT